MKLPEIVKVYIGIVIECLRVGAAVLLIVGLLWLLFAVEPGKGYSFPV